MQLLAIPGAAPLYTNTFLLLTEAGHGIAIDPAGEPQEYLDALARNGAALTHILLTHGHYDHVGAVRELKRKTGATLFLDPADRRGDAMFPLSSADEGYPADGRLTVDELELQLWHTPGHTPGSWCIYCQGALFSGDTLFAGSCGRVDLPGGSAQQMRRSLSLLANLPLPDETRVYPGHESTTTLGRERKTNPYLLGEWL